MKQVGDLKSEKESLLAQLASAERTNGSKVDPRFFAYSYTW